MESLEMETRRLVLRPLCMDDAERTQLLFPHWDIVKFLNSKVPWPYPADGVKQYYTHTALPAIERKKEWHWTIRLKESPGEHIGVISLHGIRTDNRGYWLGLPWHGRGYMTEAVAKVNDFWFDTLRFGKLQAPKAIDNIASKRISEKTGMRMIGIEERDFVSGRLMSEIWEITTGEWKEARKSIIF